MNKWLIILFILFIIIISGCTTPLKNEMTEEAEVACEDITAYSGWSECIDDSQSRTITIINCTDSSIISDYIETQECSVICESDWTCEEWGECSIEGTQTRTCTDLNECSSDYSDNQLCTFVNPCEDISDSRKKIECESLALKDATLCYSLSTTIITENCINDFSLIYSNLSSCNLINDSITRNTCKAMVSLDDSYCNILAPNYRDDCYLSIDERYSYLASVNLDSSYCDNIEDEDIYDDCISDSNYNYYESYHGNIDDCSDYTYSGTSSYQTVRACYIYHIAQDRTSTICDNVEPFVQEDCNALIIQNLTYCYDQSGNSRDWCLANFAYYNDDVSICRDGASEDNCLYTIGYWFNEIDYCNLIRDENKHDFCISHYVTFCQSHIDNCPSHDYCDLIEDNSVRKDNCIVELVEDLIKYKNYGK